MALSELETKRVDKALERFLEKRRPPAQIRDQVDLAYRIEGHSVEIFEIRPAWDEPSTKVERPVAKATFVRTRDHWKIYWLRADGNWYTYDPSAEVRTIDAFVEVVDQDQYGCFFG